ncbi:MAG: tRNA lysidine(34) synthetase TilS [candidate division WOR-3 bacterium]
MGLKNFVFRVKNTIETHKMFQGVKKAVLAFSAGPDSVCLLDVLKEIYAGKIDFTLVYVNHGLRPRGALKTEEELTAYYAKKYDCDFAIIKIKVPKTDKGLEAEARVRRYQALQEYARKIGAARIVLGHHLDDVVETFFLNLVRGSGNIGLQSIPPVKLPFVRPLLDVRKDEILDYLRSRHLKFSQDKTNLDIQFRRNFIRIKLIPLLLRLNPRLHETIKREIAILHNDEEFLEQIVRRVYKRCIQTKKDGLLLDLARLMRYNKAIRNRVLMKGIMELKGDLIGIESKHIESVWSLRDKQSGRQIFLPAGLYAQKIYDNIFLGWKKKNNQENEKEIVAGKELIFDGLKIATEIVSNWHGNKNLKNCELFDYNHLSLPLFLRHRKDGDVVLIKNGKKKLKEILNEKRVPVNERDGVVLLCDQKGILWVMGIYRAYRALVSKETKKILKVAFEYLN